MAMDLRLSPARACGPGGPCNAPLDQATALSQKLVTAVSVRRRSENSKILDLTLDFTPARFITLPIQQDQTHGLGFRIILGGHDRPIVVPRP